MAYKNSLERTFMDKQALAAELRAEAQTLLDAADVLEGKRIRAIVSEGAGKTELITKTTGARKVSPEARERMAAAQRKRWDKIKAKKKPATKK